MIRTKNMPTIQSVNPRSRRERREEERGRREGGREGEKGRERGSNTYIGIHVQYMYN